MKHTKPNLGDQSTEADKATSKPLQAMRPVTRKEAELVRIVATEPKTTQAEAYKRAYNAEKMSKASIEQEASKTLRKPSVKLEMQKYSNKAESVLFEVLDLSSKEMRLAERDRVQWANTAKATADSMLDRIHGKATIRTEVKTEAVILNIDLSTSAS